MALGARGISGLRHGYHIRGPHGPTATVQTDRLPTSSSSGTDMNIARTIVPLALLAAFATTAQAQSEKTREQVKAEWAEAVRTGDVVAPGDTGLKLNELYPQRYPHAAAGIALTRAQVKADFAE